MSDVTQLLKELQRGIADTTSDYSSAGYMLDASKLAITKAASRLLNQMNTKYEAVDKFLSPPRKLDRDEAANEIMKRRGVPPNDIDKNYKKYFWKFLDKVIPSMKKKRKSELEVFQASKASLLVSKAIVKSLVYAVLSLVSSVSSLNELADKKDSKDDTQKPDTKASDPEDLEDELEGSVTELETSMGLRSQKDKPSVFLHDAPAEEQEPKTYTQEQYSSYVSDHRRSISDLADFLSDKSKAIEDVFRYADHMTMKSITDNGKAAVVLSRLLMRAASAASSDLQPALYVAFSGLAKAFSVYNNAVYLSAALNRTQRKELTDHMKQLEEAGGKTPLQSL